MTTETSNSKSNTSDFQWPVFDSIGQAAKALGVPEFIVKRAKRLGCPAFTSNRIHSDGLLSWTLQQLAIGPDGKTAMLDPGQELAKVNKARAEKIEMENAASRMDLVPRGIVESLVAPYGQAIRSSVMEFPDRYCARANPEHPEVARAAFTEWRDAHMKAVYGLVNLDPGNMPTEPPPAPATEPITPTPDAPGTNLEVPK